MTCAPLDPPLFSTHVHSDLDPFTAVGHPHLSLSSNEPQAAFAWAEPAAEVLAWDQRWPRLLAELKASAADVICLQEVQFEPTPEGGFALPKWLAPLTCDGGGECKGFASTSPSHQLLACLFVVGCSNGVRWRLGGAACCRIPHSPPSRLLLGRSGPFELHPRAD